MAGTGRQGSGRGNYRGAGNNRDERAGGAPRGGGSGRAAGGRGGAGGGRGGSYASDPRRGGRPDRRPTTVHEGERSAREAQEGVRLQKVLAQAGIGSRRACEELIDLGRVEVDGRVVREQGLRVDPAKVEIKVDGLRIPTSSGEVYIALNKPSGVVSTMHDPDGRPTLAEYVTDHEQRLFHVGRLDTETEGLILLTNHGELSNRLTHPRYEVRKTYLAQIQGPIPRDLGKRLKAGVELDDGLARADSFRIIDQLGKTYMVEVVLHEGRKHIVRRMLAELGFPVERLVRTKFGPIQLGDQRPGRTRRLSNEEIGLLFREVGL
ncbi:rRNA pseudouridine synthase [Yinghuangia sp. ASG 101]|uniref:pseudouridine synthase n=1 Tax=Yinghuangia sp. ASG 101 TaxID=2896848 RepID=UPI001E461CF0|nr:pseudouridine synthase [Yinghuangia sp. ASG 101]UGQ10259.1 rRNA pseudouridine synthase [Yinghuangia sp. ASG 101]